MAKIYTIRLQIYRDLKDQKINKKNQFKYDRGDFE